MLKTEASRPRMGCEVPLAENRQSDYLPAPLSLKFPMSVPGQREDAPLGPLGRVLLGFWSVLLLVGFAIAWDLEPDPRGFGTHERLGLPPCSFRMLVGKPCPSCGMTTSFSHFVRGRFTASAEANFAGFCLAVVCAAQVPWAWISIRTGRWWRIARPDAVLFWLILGLTALCLAEWIVRLLLSL